MKPPDVHGAVHLVAVDPPHEAVDVVDLLVVQGKDHVVGLQLHKREDPGGRALDDLGSLVVGQARGRFFAVVLDVFDLAALKADGGGHGVGGEFNLGELGGQGDGFELGLLHPELVHGEVDPPDGLGQFLIGDGVVAVGGVGKARVAVHAVFIDAAFALRFLERFLQEKQVLVDALAPVPHADRAVAFGHDVAVHHVAAVFQPDVQAQRIVEGDVVVHRPQHAVAQLDAAA